MNRHTKINVSTRTQLLAVLLVATSTISFAQKFGIKIYQNSDIFKTTERDDNVDIDKWQFNMTRFSVAFDIRATNNLTHEIELFIPESSKRISNLQFPNTYTIKKSSAYANRGSAYSGRYELSKKISKGDGPVSFYVGAGVNPYWLKIENKPVEPDYPGYSSDSKVCGAALNVTPSVNYTIGKNVRIGLSLPVKVFTLETNITTINNPNIPIRQQKNKETTGAFFEQAFTMRLGIAYLFGS